MKKKKLLLTILASVIIFQFIVPISMIVRREVTLRTGDLYRFKTAPVDPADPFRGRYVALRFDESELLLTTDQTWISGEMLYALVTVNADGYAELNTLTRTCPAAVPYLKVKVRYVGSSRVEGKSLIQKETYTDHEGKEYHYQSAVFLDLPFNRYYMEESKAPKAEALYRDRNRDALSDAFVTVRIKKGFAVLDELYINGQPVNELL